MKLGDVFFILTMILWAMGTCVCDMILSLRIPWIEKWFGLSLADQSKVILQQEIDKYRNML